jgi:hypothetical protein
MSTNRGQLILGTAAMAAVTCPPRFAAARRPRPDHFGLVPFLTLHCLTEVRCQRRVWRRDDKVAF